MDECFDALFDNCDGVLDQLCPSFLDCDNLCGGDAPFCECLCNCFCDLMTVGLGADCDDCCSIDCCARLVETMTGSDKDNISNAECQCDACCDICSENMSLECIVGNLSEMCCENVVCMACAYACENPITNMFCPPAPRDSTKSCNVCCISCRSTQKKIQQETFFGNDLGDYLDEEVGRNIPSGIPRPNQQYAPYTDNRIVDNEFDIEEC